ncbi:MAG: tRNA lysidine(34) synthetase TilS [Thermoguttaceae bacterium]
MAHPIESQLSQSWPPDQWADVTVLVALSGGCDSVALLRAMVAIRAAGVGRLRAAHLNHRLRPEADADARFVAELCERLDVPCEVGTVDVAALASRRGEGIEAAARHARYRFLGETAGRLGSRFVVTGHTADDQAETILHRIVRGTGIRGLAGMARTRPLGHATLVRPLLGVAHAALEAYLESLDQPFLSDPSNRDSRFTRNRIRMELLPRLKADYNPDVAAALQRLGTLAGEATAVLDGLVDQWSDRCVTSSSRNAARIELVALMGKPSYLVRELLMAVWRHHGWPLQAMGMAKWDELATLARNATSARRDFPGGVAVEVADAAMWLRRSDRHATRSSDRVA